MTTTADLTTILRQFTLRYHRALVMRAGFLTALGWAACGALAWRLAGWRVGIAWSVGCSILLALVLAAAVAWWVRRRWISEADAATHLDQTFALQQRLITAAEVASSQQDSPLYPLLMEDVARRCSPERARVPRVIDHTTGLLAIALLLLLLWPSAGQAPFHMHVPGLTLPQEPPDHKNPPSPTSEEQRSRKNDSSRQPSPSSQGGQSQSSSGGAASSQGSPNQQQSGGGSQQGTQQQSSQGAGGGSPNAQTNAKNQSGTGRSQRAPDGKPQTGTGAQQAGNGSSSSSDRSQGNGNQPMNRAKDQRGAAQSSQEAGQNNGEGAGKNQQPAGDSHQSKSDGAQRAGQDHQQQAGEGQETDQSSAQGHQQQASQSGKERQQAQSGAMQNQANGRPQSMNGKQESGRQGAGETGRGNLQSSQAAASLQQLSSQGTSQSPGNQEAMKAEIQQLLKQVSGELKQLQAQLADQKDLPHPEAGTGTDPNLYEAPMTPESSTGNSVPIQLRTDAAQIKTQRPSGGVGRPSSEASNATPQTQAEAAQLSEEPQEEAPIAKQPVPPEYRSVFDRLHQQQAQPKETKP